jgi:hypothetical protein
LGSGSASQRGSTALPGPDEHIRWLPSLGYPGISIIDASGNAVPLEYVHTRDQVVTGEQPGWVDLGPGATAYITVNKYRCDTRTIATATSLRLLLPDDNSALQISIVGNASMAY